MCAGIEPLFFSSMDKDSHTILRFTLRHNITTARERRRFVPLPVKKDSLRNREISQEANRQKGKAKGNPKGQGKPGKVKGKSK